MKLKWALPALTLFVRLVDPSGANEDVYVYTHTNGYDAFLSHRIHC